MRAVRVHEGGELRHEEVADPVAGPGEVLVELRAASVNRRDLLVRFPPSPAYEFRKPLIPGSDGAGVRRDTGQEVVVYPAFGWDDALDAGGSEWELLGGPRDGTYAELLAVPAGNLYAKPAHLSFEEAAALPVAGLTAYRALATVGRAHEGQTVLVLGAGSGVSTFAVMLADEWGLRVLVTSSSEEKIARARELGADGGVLYTDDAWPDHVRELTGGRGVDLVVDSVGTTWDRSARCLRRGGRLVVLGGTGGPQVELDVRHVYLNWLSILGTTLGSPTDFASFLRAVQRAELKPMIDRVLPLAEADAAHELLQSATHQGKLVLAIR